MTANVITASTLTDGQATISNNVVTAGILSDGQATITGNVVTAATLTDGQATISNNVVTAATITDGEATITGNVVTAATITDGQATISNNVVTAGTLSDGQATITGGSLDVETINVNSITQSTNTTSGSLIVSGGVGIEKQLNVGGTIFTNNSAAINLKDNQLQLRNNDENHYIQYNLDIDGPRIAGWKGAQIYESQNDTIIANLVSSGIELTKLTTISDTTESSNVTSGAFTVMGGVGIVKDLYVGGNIYGNIDSANTTVTSSSVSIDSDEIRLGSSAGQTNQGTRAVAVGGASGVTNQGSYSVAVGWASGYSNQGNDSVAIGRDAGNTSQGTNSIAIGKDAGKISQSDNTICLNATGSTVAANTNTDACYIAPIREDTSGNGQVLYYDNTTKEVHQSDVGFSLVNGNAVVDSDMAITSTTNSTTTTNGALTVAGGVGIATNLNVGNAIFNSTGTLVLKGGATGGSGATYRLESGGNSYIDSNTVTFRNQAGNATYAILNSTETQLLKNTLKIGSDMGTSGCTIYMEGVQSDAGFDHSVIETRLYNGIDKSELLLFKGNDTLGGNLDRIRLRTGQIVFDALATNTVDREAENIVATVDSDGVNIESSTESTSTTTGALTVSGGVGIAKKLNVGDGIYNSTGTLFLQGGAPGGSGANFEIRQDGDSIIDSNTVYFRKQDTDYGTTLDVRGTLILGSGQISILPSADGALYRYNGQLEMMVDDNFYIRDLQSRKVHFKFNTGNGFFLPKGTGSSKNGTGNGFQVKTDGSNDRVVIHQIEDGGGGYWYWNRSFNNGKISDIRMKENINDIEQEDLDFLMNIRPRKYKLVDSPEDCCQYGVVAQEILPHILNDSQKNIIHNYDEYVNGDETKMLGVSYISFVPLLIKHNQQQQASIEELQTTVTTLQEENASLKQRLENIEKFLNMV